MEEIWTNRVEDATVFIRRREGLVWVISQFVEWVFGIFSKANSTRPGIGVGSRLIVRR
jgi:hypothetical protein